MTERSHRLAVAICGAGHSGSTLLGLVLGSHSRVFYAGEAKKSLFVGDSSKPRRKRVCKICGETCPVWSRFVSPGAPDLYESLARLTGREVVVDSTKDVAWIRARKAELDAVRVPQKLVFLTRDGRAVVNSRLRKAPERDPAALVDAWMKKVREAAAYADERGEDALWVRYEDLASEPAKTVRRVCTHLGLAFEPEMLRYETKTHHPLGGNTGTQSLVARNTSKTVTGDGETGNAVTGNAVTRQAETLAVVPDRSRGYYEPMRGGFRLDLRWQSELPADVLSMFEARAGALNERFRWGDDGVKDDER